MRRARSILPSVRLSEEAFRSRHGWLRLILWLQLPTLAVVAVVSHDGNAVADTMPGMAHAGGNALVWLMASLLALCAVASTAIRGRRVGAATASLGLLLSAALLVSLGGGRTDLHFGYFVVLGLISLYQDWVPLVLSVLLVTGEHLVMGALAPGLLYSDPNAHEEPVVYALLHAGFILASCAVQVAYWRFSENAQRETDRVRADGERALRRTAERFEALVQDSADVILVVRPDGLIQSASAASVRVMGLRPEELAGLPHAELVHPDDRSLLGAEPRVEVRVRHADGAWHWHDVTARDLTANPAVAGVVVNHRDVSERRAIQERLRYEATHDALTGLSNRAEFLRTLDRALAATAAGPPTVAVLYLDLDGFKQINDSHGHETGDAVLVAVAAGLRRSLLGSDTAARLGGDEFAVVLTGVSRPADAEAVAARILSELTQPLQVGPLQIGPLQAGPVTLRPRASIGIALAEPGELRTDTVMHRADTAMYHAKRAGMSTWQQYVPGMHDPSLDGQELEDELRHAVDRDQLRLHYQPVADLATGTLTGVEALVRWQHPERGLLPPEVFLPLAAHSALIHTIGRWVLHTAALQVRQWQTEVAPGLRLSVNVSRQQFESPLVIDEVLATLHDTGLSPGDLVLEIAETAVVDADGIVARMAELRGHGVRFALDDFGAGTSSLRHLTRLPVDMLKLDPYFVTTLDGTPNGSAVAEAVIRLGHALQLETVAEGVETAAQAAELTLLGCGSGQGHHFARPMTPGEAESLLRSGGALRGNPQPHR